LDGDLHDSETASADFGSIESSGPAADFVTRPTQAAPSLDEAQLLKAIYLLIAFGGGMFVLLIGYIIIASILGGNRPLPPSVPTATTSQPAVMPPQPLPSEPVPQPAAPAAGEVGGGEPAVMEPSAEEASGHPAAGPTPDSPEPTVPESDSVPPGDADVGIGAESKTE
jgi:hypothetical protein